MGSLFCQTLDTLDGVVKSELDWGLILYGEEEEDYLATTEGGFWLMML